MHTWAQAHAHENNHTKAHHHLIAQNQWQRTYSVLQADWENRCILDKKRMIGKKTDFYKEKLGKLKYNYEWYIYFALSPDTF